MVEEIGTGRMWLEPKTDIFANADALRKATGASSVTYRDETRNADGSLTLNAQATSAPSEEPGTGRNGFPGNPNASAAQVAREEARLDAKYAAHDAAVAACSKCKGAKTRLSKLILDVDRISPATRKGMCSRHYNSRNFYATSPLSENYWTS